MAITSATNKVKLKATTSANFQNILSGYSISHFGNNICHKMMNSKQQHLPMFETAKWLTNVINNGTNICHKYPYGNNISHNVWQQHLPLHMWAKYVTAHKNYLPKVVAKKHLPQYPGITSALLLYGLTSAITNYVNICV